MPLKFPSCMYSLTMDRQCAHKYGSSPVSLPSPSLSLYLPLPPLPPFLPSLSVCGVLRCPPQGSVPWVQQVTKVGADVCLLVHHANIFTPSHPQVHQLEVLLCPTCSPAYEETTALASAHHRLCLEDKVLCELARGAHSPEGVPPVERGGDVDHCKVGGEGVWTVAVQQNNFGYMMSFTSEAPSCNAYVHIQSVQTESRLTLQLLF